MFKFELGSRVRCVVTGFKGIVTGRSEYMNGCVNYCVKPPINEKGEMVEGQWLDEPQLELMDVGLAEERKTWPIHSGGPREDQAPER